MKTIRLSKNIFSLTERLPKSKYNSPKVLTSGQHLIGNQSTVNKPTTNLKQTMSGKGLDSISKRGKSRLQDYLDS